MFDLDFVTKLVMTKQGVIAGLSWESDLWLERHIYTQKDTYLLIEYYPELNLKIMICFEFKLQLDDYGWYLK